MLFEAGTILRKAVWATVQQLYVSNIYKKHRSVTSGVVTEPEKKLQFIVRLSVLTIARPKQNHTNFTRIVSEHVTPIRI